MTAGRRLALDDAPLTAAEAAPLFAGFAAAAKVLIAVSGGPDSVALMNLAAETVGRSSRLAVASVDHGLRDGSRTIAEGVVSAALALGLPARILDWTGPKPRTRIQETARRRRYELLVAEARRIGASHLVTAHTLDDQAETVLFRMIRGSGPEGLAGMRDESLRDGIVHLRPLLGIPKARLVAACRAANWPYESDPGNLDPRYARGRLRRLMPLLAEEGLDAAGFARLAGRLREADDAILDAARRVSAAAERAPGIYRVAPLSAAPVAVRRRALGLILAETTGRGPPRLERLERYERELASAAAGGRALRRNLHGVLLCFDGEDQLVLSAEPSRRAADKADT